MVKSVLIFPGQGAQKVGMGKDLADRFPAAREVFQSIDDALDVALSRLMWEGPEDELTLTHNAQPAILAHSTAVHTLVRSAISPVAAAGHSLGEYSAYVAAGSLPVRDAARLVRRRGELMLEAGEAREGTMAAVLGLATEAVERACRQAGTDGSVVVAGNLNTPDQTVISGDPDAVSRAGEACKEAGAKRVLPLNVSGAFHSALMEPAREGLDAALGTVDFADPAFPVVANASAKPVRDGGTAVRLLREQLVSPVRWVGCMEWAARVAEPDAAFLELGPGKVLAGLLKRIVKGVTVQSLGTADDVTAFMEAHG
ncbi:MAG: ACP S-malonyltransferase [Gemmatimonadetes bacterium]|nr:ACP S-malonyltransferase [Gemmatimonadota bacterium]